MLLQIKLLSLIRVTIHATHVALWYGVIPVSICLQALVETAKIGPAAVEVESEELELVEPDVDRADAVWYWDDYSQYMGK